MSPTRSFSISFLLLYECLLDVNLLSAIIAISFDKSPASVCFVISYCQLTFFTTFNILVNATSSLFFSSFVRDYSLVPSKRTFPTAVPKIQEYRKDKSLKNNITSMMPTLHQQSNYCVLGLRQRFSFPKRKEYSNHGLLLTVERYILKIM